jgi:hypothetical protein
MTFQPHTFPLPRCLGVLYYWAFESSKKLSLAPIFIHLLSGWSSSGKVLFTVEVLAGYFNGEIGYPCAFNYLFCTVCR